MYTECIIQYVDDGTELNVIIKDNDEMIEEEDENIFFYGLTRAELLTAWRTGDVVENEWRVTYVGDTYDMI